jgi:hypothetical protein
VNESAASFAAIERAAELAVLAGDDVRLGRAIDALGLEIAKRDPVTRAMLDLDEQLQALAVMQLAATRAGVLVKRGDA